jgi:hypothetical protein
MIDTPMVIRQSELFTKSCDAPSARSKCGVFAELGATEKVLIDSEAMS